MSNNHKHRLPAEWEPHETTWIAWPHNKNDWPGKFSSIKWVYAEIVKYISFGEKVFIIVHVLHRGNQDIQVNKNHQCH
ncbi:MAG: agmatine deiminase family protein [Bacteroidetes bacterium]|nr:agmatine deiminase family protein [Bacteroidota bacterium]